MMEEKIEYNLLHCANIQCCSKHLKDTEGGPGQHSACKLTEKFDMQ